MTGWGALASFLVAAGVAGAAGCGTSARVERQAGETCRQLETRETDRDEAASLPAAADPADSADASAPTLYFAPGSEPAPLDPPPPATSKAAGTDAGAAPEGQEAGKPAAQSIKGMTFGEIVLSDLKAAPGRLWNGTKLSFGTLQNVAILGGVFGVDRIVRNNADARVRHELVAEHSDWGAWGDLGNWLGHPGLHFGLAGAWYLESVATQDDQGHDRSKVLIEALAINDLSTGLLQVSVNQKDPRGNYYAWPSGHTSSSFCVASVLHEYYGWQVGIPAYILSAGIAATRVGERQHNISDTIFGAGLGIVIGHSVVRGEMPKIAGFSMMPYCDEDAVGLMFVKGW